MANKGVIFQPGAEEQSVPEQPASAPVPVHTHKVQQPTKESEEQKLNDLVKKSNRILYRLKSVFPFTFFPDEIIVDESKVTFIERLFFYSKMSRAVAIDDILTVTVSHGPIFARLTLVDRFFQEQPMYVEYLRKKDATRARTIIQGLMLARREGVELEKIDLDTLKKRIEELGSPEVVGNQR